MTGDDSRLVYSTEQAIPRKGGDADDRDRSAPARPGEQRVKVRLERKQRGGKSVTVIEGLQMTRKGRETLLKQLKAQLGTGGTIKDDLFEIQGDHCNAVSAALEKMGFKPKRSGG